MKQNNKATIGSMLQNSFTAVGLSEGDRDIARNYLSKEPEIALWKQIKEVYRKYQIHFVAAALAEGCPDTARRYMEQHLDYSSKSSMESLLNKTKRWFQNLEKTFAAAGLAEGDPDIARSYLAPKKPTRSKTKQSLRQFLATTGLKDVQYQYGLLAA